MIRFVSDKKSHNGKKASYGQAYEIKQNYHRRVLASAGIVVFSCLFVGCGKTVEEEPIVVVEKNVETIGYKLSNVERSDVILTSTLGCNYVQTKEQDVVFDFGGKRIDRVYVKEGDIVKEGDVLVELEIGDVKEEIARLEYEIAKEEKQLSYVDKTEEFELADSYYGYVYGSKMEEDDLKYWEERDEQIKENNTYKREDYSDQLEFNKRKLNKLKAELDGNRVYAKIGGTVISVEKDLEGSTAKKDQTIMKIVDNADGIFESTEVDKASYFKEGEAVSMNIVYGTAKGDYELMPSDMASWGEKLIFSVLSMPDGVSLEVGTLGTISVVVDKRENVLSIPFGALNEADGKYYVYVLDENDLRQVRYVETGLIGDDKVEILSGLEEGEAVVRK